MTPGDDRIAAAAEPQGAERGRHRPGIAHADLRLCGRAHAQARRDAEPPLLDPASDELLVLAFTDTSLREIIGFLGDASGINVTYDEQFEDRAVSLDLVNVTFDEALDHLLWSHGAFYKVVNPTTILVAPDTPEKSTAYEEQAIRTFYISHGDGPHGEPGRKRHRRRRQSRRPRRTSGPRADRRTAAAARRGCGGRRPGWACRWASRTGRPELATPFPGMGAPARSLSDLAGTVGRQP